MKQIKITRKNQNVIHFLPFNRPCSVRDDLIEKMNKYGFTVPIIIIETDLITGKKEKFTADGQHRLVTGLHLNLEVLGNVLDIVFKDINEIVLFVSSLNSTHKSWAIPDYVTAYTYLNFKDYILLNKITNGNTYSIQTIANLLYGYRSTGHISNSLKKGTFKCNLIKETIETLEFQKKLSKIGKLTSRMLLALHYVYHIHKDFNKDKFYDTYKDNYEKVKELNLDDYTDIFSSWVK